MNKVEQILFDIMALGLVLFYSYSAVIAPAATQYHRGIYVVITYILVFLVYRSKHPVARVGDFLLIALSIGTLGYWILNFEAINYRAGAETEIDKWIAIAGVLVGVEVARRVVGMVFVVMGGVMLAYGVFGEYAPATPSRTCAPASFTRATACSASWPTCSRPTSYSS